MNHRCNPGRFATLGMTGLVAAGLLFAVPARALVEKAPAPLDARTRFYPGFHELPGGVNLADSPDLLSLRSDWRSFLSSHPEERVFLDPQTGRIHAVSGGIPWIPGLGNDLTMADISRYMTGPFSSPGIPELESIARDFMSQNATLFQIPKSMSLKLSPNASIASSASTWSLWFDVIWNDVPVNGASVAFVVKHGNLILWGTRGIDDIAIPDLPALSPFQARDLVEKYIGGFLAGVDTFTGDPQRVVFPDRSGTSHGYRDVWEVRFTREGEGSYVGRVDAQSGAILEFFDEADYAQVKGGIYPKTNTAGTEVVKPLGFADYGTGLYSDSGATFTYSGGTVTSKLAGRYVTISDACGAISLSASASPGDLNFGTSTGTDCTTPGVGGAGNTHSSRSCYYHVDLIKQKGRVFYPSNSWLNANITCNVNINSTCNAFWNGSTLNFYRKGASACGNTGEIAAIFLHEWGHGMDSNDGNGAGGSGEAMGDTVAMLQIRDSCIGQNFTTSNCGGYGNACTSCTGVRDQDRAKHATNEILTPGNIATRCTSTGGDPCGREVHCEGMLPANTVWDLAFRDLPARPMATEDAWALIDKLWWESGATRNAAYTCTDKTAPYLNNGCGASSWFMTFMAADDDDGNLSNGTPHAATIFGAFDRHGISCGLSTDASNTDHTICPTIGSVGTITATAGNNSVTIAWSKATNAAFYRILRNNTGCGTGMTEIARPADTGSASQSYVDTTASNGNSWSYQVQPIGSNADCVGSISNCVSATPQPAPEVRYVSGSAIQTADSGDNDGFPDNCETITVQVTLANTGGSALTNVRITGLTSSFGGVALVTPLPITVGSLAAGATANATFQYTLGAGATKATCGQNVPFTITVSATEMSGTTSGSFSFTGEQDIVLGNATYDFETDLGGWTITGGTWSRVTTYGGSSGSYGMTSSNGVVSSCDRIQSPMFTLTAASALAVGVRWDIEANSQGKSWDRANFGLIDVTSGTRNQIIPSGGRTYTSQANSPAGLCVVTGQTGYNGSNDTTWGDATFTSADLLAAWPAGTDVYLDLTYSTDTSVTGTGMRFDNVRLTNVMTQGCDAQSNTCGCSTPAAPGAPTLTPSCTSVGLTWTAVGGATDYEVWRNAGANCTGAVQVVATTGGATSYSNTGLTAGTQYSYFIKAKNSCGTSGNGTCATTTTLAGPAAPTLAVPTVSCTGVALSWGAVSGATGYDVQRSAGNCAGGYTSIGTTTGTTFNDTTAVAGTVYGYVVIATSSCGNSANSNCRSVTASGIPAAPAAPTPTPGCTNVSLSWTAVAAATDYEVWRNAGASCTGATLVVSTTAGATTYNNTGLTAGTQYSYFIKAKNTCGTSGNGGCTTTSTLSAPVAPVLSSATPGDSQVALAWTDVAGETGFQVYRGASGGPYSPVGAALPANTVAWTDTGLSNGTQYCYVVVAIGTCGNSPNSNQLCATPVACTSTTDFSDGFEAGTGSWTLSAGANPAWSSVAPPPGNGTAVLRGNNNNKTSKCGFAQKTTAVALSAASTSATLQFWSQAATIATDNGIVQVSTDGGTTWAKLTTLAYPARATNATAGNCTANIAVGDPVFSGTVAAAVYTADLTAYKGTSLLVRFTLVTGATGSTTSYWYVDDVVVFESNGTAPTAPQGNDLVQTKNGTANHLAWGAVTGATGYDVYWTSDPVASQWPDPNPTNAIPAGWNKANAGPITALAWDHPTVVGDTSNYYYHVTPRNDCGANASEPR